MTPLHIFVALMYIVAGFFSCAAVFLALDHLWSAAAGGWILFFLFFGAGTLASTHVFEFHRNSNRRRRTGG